MHEEKTNRPGPLALELVQNIVQRGSKSHLLSLEEDRSTSPQEKNDATPLNLGSWKKAGVIR